jgi:large subunit ribosomal protein L15
MALHSLPKLIDKKKRRVGQGHGSGRVKTSGRGTKGQKARSKVPMTFEGGALPLIKRLPFLRGKGRNYSIQSKPVILNVSDLNKLPASSTVDLPTLIKHKLVQEDDVKQFGIKILGNGDLSVQLTVKVPVSQNARVKIEKAKGTIIDAHE